MDIWNKLLIHTRVFPLLFYSVVHFCQFRFAGLNRLAMSDDNKLKINDNNGVPLYLEMLQSSSLPEQEEACKGLWTLCFNQIVADKISRNSDALSGIRLILNSS